MKFQSFTQVSKYKKSLSLARYLWLLPILVFTFSACTRIPNKQSLTNKANQMPLATLSGNGANIYNLEFGDVSSGGASARSIVLSNPTTRPMTNLEISISDPKFQFKGGVYPGVGGTCGSTLAGLGSCLLVLSYGEIQGSGLQLRKISSSRSLVLISLDAQLSIFFMQNGARKSNTVGLRLNLDTKSSSLVAQSQALSVLQDTDLKVTLQAASSDSSPFTYSIVSGPAHGSLSGTAPDLTYTPASKYSGADSFTFKASNASAESNIALVNLTVIAAKLPPVALAVNLSVVEDTKNTGFLLSSSASNGQRSSPKGLFFPKNGKGDSGPCQIHSFLTPLFHF